MANLAEIPDDVKLTIWESFIGEKITEIQSDHHVANDANLAAKSAADSASFVSDEPRKEIKFTS